MKRYTSLTLGVLLLGVGSARAQAPLLMVPEASPSASVTHRHHHRLPPAGGGQAKNLGGARPLR